MTLNELIRKISGSMKKATIIAGMGLGLVDPVEAFAEPPMLELKLEAPSIRDVCGEDEDALDVSIKGPCRIFLDYNGDSSLPDYQLRLEFRLPPSSRLFFDKGIFPCQKVDEDSERQYSLPSGDFNAYIVLVPGRAYLFNPWSRKESEHEQGCSCADYDRDRPYIPDHIEIDIIF